MAVRDEITIDEVHEKRDDAHFAVHFANRKLVERDWSQACYVDGRRALDQVMLHLAKGKWLLGRATGTHAGFVARSDSQADLTEAAGLFDYVTGRAKEIEQSLLAGESPPEPGRADIVPSHDGTEILFADGVPLIPTSCPIVVLEGSNRDMGRQYSKQILDVYGDFILAWHAQRELSDSEISEIGRWEEELARHAPEMLDFARGMAEGATAWGLGMDYRHALALFTGVRPPAVEAEGYVVLGVKKQPAETPAPCSGACGWGEATSDGRLVAGTTTDHDCGYQATIVAFPEEGNKFVLTPLSANSSLPGIGLCHFAGQPGMNDKGLAYIHHGGASMGEPAEEWGYGLRRGPAVMHILQFCDTAKEALDYALSLPVGDQAVPLGSVGGIFADSEYGVAIEARAGSPDNPKPIVREYTYDPDEKAYNVLYGTNNALAPESGHLNGAPTSGKGYDYSIEGGWHTFDPEVIRSGPPAESIRRRMTKGSEGRNRFLHRMLRAGYGDLDLDYMTMTYRVSGDIPEGDFDDVARRYHAGEQWDVSAAHRSNAFVSVFKPDEGVYRACIGPANRAVNSRDPGHGFYYYDETAAFWEIKLAGSPAELVDTGRELAERRVAAATDTLSRIGEDFAGHGQVRAWCEEARSHILEGQKLCAAANAQTGDDRLGALSPALREYNWAQVRANQVVDAIAPPPDSPELLEQARPGT